MKQRDPREEQKAPDWHGFGKILAIGHLRQIGLAPIPKEVKERLKREGLLTEDGKEKSAG